MPENVFRKLIPNGIDIQCNPFVKKPTLMLSQEDWERFEKVKNKLLNKKEGG